MNLVFEKSCLSLFLQLLYKEYFHPLVSLRSCWMSGLGSVLCMWGGVTDRHSTPPSPSDRSLRWLQILTTYESFFSRKSQFDSRICEVGMNWCFSVGVFVTISLGWSTCPCLSWTFVVFRTKSFTSQEPSQSWQTRIAGHPTSHQYAVHHHNILDDQPVSAVVWGGSLSTHTLTPHHMSWAERLNRVPTSFMLWISNTLSVLAWRIPGTG